MNYTRPNDPDHVDDPKDWLNANLIFARALGQVLEEGAGVVVDIEGDARNPAGFSDKVIVFKMGGKIHVDDFSEDLPEGTICVVSQEGST